MEKLKIKLPFILQKYKYVMLVALIGIILMLLPSHKEPVKDEIPKVVESSGSTQQELENILSQIEGAGNVRVMLREKIGEETIYQTNDHTSDEGHTVKMDTVVITDSDRNEGGLVKQIIPSQYIGAIVLCQGGDHTAVKLAVADAVSKITGLGMDKIAVLKMK